MRALHPPADDADGRAFGEIIRPWAMSGRPLRESVTTGLELHLESEEQAGPVIPSRPLPCQRCQQQQAAQAPHRDGAAGQPSKGHPLDGAEPGEHVDFANLMPLLQRPAFVRGIRAR